MRFGFEEFPFLLSPVEPYENTYTDVGFQHVTEAAAALGMTTGEGESAEIDAEFKDVFDPFYKFVNFIEGLGAPLTGDGELDGNRLMTIFKNPENDKLELWAAAIFAPPEEGVDCGDSKLVLKVGNNLFPLSVKDTGDEHKLVGGVFSGGFTEEEQNGILRVTWKATRPKDKTVYEIPVLLDRDSSVSKDDLSSTLRVDGDLVAIASQLKKAIYLTGGRGYAQKIKFLPPGEYPIRNIREIGVNEDFPEWGIEWRFEIPGMGDKSVEIYTYQASLNANLKMISKSPKYKQMGEATLIVNSNDPFSALVLPKVCEQGVLPECRDGFMANVQQAIATREAKKAAEEAGNALPPVAVTAPAKQLAAVGGGVIDESKLDDIPF